MMGSVNGTGRIPGALTRKVQEGKNMALVRWNPVGQLASMEIDRLNQMFDELYAGAVNRGWAPPVDIYETDAREVVIKAELPDFRKDDIAVTFDNSVLTIKGERKAEEGLRPEQFQHRERRFGTFSRSFTLPATVDASKIGASYKDGVLTIRVPQREEAKPKQITVQGE
jgi:HSP20 family protein